MKKSLIVISLLITSLAIGGYFAYRYVFLQDEIDDFSLIPKHALLVYSSENIADDWEKLLKQDVWIGFEGIPSLRKAKKDVAFLDTLMGSNSLASILKGRIFLASMHATTKDEFDFLYVTKISSVSDQKIFDNLIDKLKEENNFKEQSRQFNGFKIVELRDPSKGKSFTYILYKDYLIGSFSTILVEDVIRNINSDFSSSFLADKLRADSLTGINTESGKIYVNLKGLPNLLSLFKKGSKGEDIILNNFGGVTLLELNMKEGELFVNGFTDPGGINDDTFLKTFQGLEPGPIRIANYLPGRTAILNHFTFQDGKSWLLNLQSYWHSKNPEHLKQWESLEAAYGVTLTDIYGVIGNEVGLATLESVEVSEPDKIVYMHTPNAEAAMSLFDSIAFQVSKSSGDTVFTESYGNTVIRQIDTRDFPAQVFGSLFKGFTSTYYMPLDDYMLFGNSGQVLKSLINDIEQEDTWGKSVKYNQFLSNTIKESNYSMVVNVPRAWPFIISSLSPSWKKIAEDQKNQLRSTALWGIQFSNVDEDFYTSITYQKNSAPLANNVSERIMNKYQVYLDNPIISKPFLVKNGQKGNIEVMLQDSAKILYLISSEARILWKDSLDGRIIGDIEQIDYYNNGTFQYLFATDKSIYIYDRDGELIPGYPLSPDYTVNKLNVIDYDKSKNYRIIASDSAGNIYMYNKNGENLEGWNPRSMEYSLAVPPDHLRVRARDIIYTIEGNGLVKAWTRRGELYPGFPVSVEGKVNSPLFFEIGSNFSQTKFTIVSASGMVSKYNMEGESVNTEQLYKPSANTSFRLLSSSSRRSFFILRQDLRRVALLTKNGETLFEKDYLSPEEMMVQYFFFGTEKEFVAVTDTVQDFSYLYDLSGKLINDQPIESNNEIELYYSERESKYYVYSAYERKLSISIF